MKSKYRAIKVNGKKHDEHRYIIEQIIGRKLGFNEVVHHKDKRKFNNDASNLEVMNRAEHTRLHQIGKTPSNSTKELLRKHGQAKRTAAKLTIDQVIVIKKLLATGLSLRIVADSYNVHKATISRISTGKAWGWLDKAIFPIGENVGSNPEISR